MSAAKGIAAGKAKPGTGKTAKPNSNSKGGGKTGKFIDKTREPLTKAEKRVVDDLVGQGKTVERIPRDPEAINKTPDFKVDGVKTELKTLENANTNTGMKRIRKGFQQNAETFEVIVGISTVVSTIIAIVGLVRSWKRKK